MKYKNDLLKIFKGKNESKFNAYSQIDEEEGNNHINENWVNFQFTNYYNN